MSDKPPRVCISEIPEWVSFELFPWLLLTAWRKARRPNPIWQAEAYCWSITITFLLFMACLAWTIHYLGDGRYDEAIISTLCAVASLFLSVQIRKTYRQKSSKFGEAVSCLAVFLKTTLKDLRDRPKKEVQELITERVNELVEEAHKPGVPSEKAIEILAPVREAKGRDGD